MLNQMKSLSINKLAEYLDANALRRAAIVRQRISEDAFAPAYYTLAQSGMRSVALASNPASVFLTETEKIRRHAGWGPYPKKLIENNLEALQGLWLAFQSGILPDSSRHYRLPGSSQPNQILSDVRITSRSDLELVVTSVRGSARYGAVKFYLNKEHPLTSHSGAVLAALLENLAKKVYGDRNVSREGIYVIDAFKGTIFNPPRSCSRMVKEATAAAKEFSMHWDFLVRQGR